MAEIIVAANAGFCRGVRRAVEQTESLAATAHHGRIVTLGPLIHNPQVVARLRAKGIQAVDEKEVRENDLVVIRSHGVPADQVHRLEATCQIHDATCPYVRSCQNIALRMAAEGYAILLVGDKGHPETASVISFAAHGAAQASRPAPAFIVADPSEMHLPELRNSHRVAVLAQTTIDQPRLKRVVEACLDRFVEVRVFNTICESTAQRQTEASALARTADVVIVVGGHNSANTTRLAEACSAIQPRTYHVETAEELMRSWVTGARTIAVTAGASTPDSTIKDVVARLSELCD